MKEKSENSLLSGKAFQIFKSELAKHLGSYDNFLISKSVLSKDLQREFSAKFHTIRGGSGFFGLDKIAEYSHMLEDLLGKENFDHQDDFMQCQQIFEKLKEASAGLFSKESGESNTIIED